MSQELAPSPGPPAPKPARRSIVLEVVAGTLLAFALIMAIVGFFFGTSLYNAFTAQAELTIEPEADTPTALYVLASNPRGMEFVIRPTMKKTITVPAGEYSLSLMGRKPGSKARLSAQKIELKRGRHGVVRIITQQEN